MTISLDQVQRAFMKALRTQSIGFVLRVVCWYYDMHAYNTHLGGGTSSIIILTIAIWQGRRNIFHLGVVGVFGVWITRLGILSESVEHLENNGRGNLPIPCHPAVHTPRLVIIYSTWIRAKRSIFMKKYKIRWTKIFEVRLTACM